MDNKNAKQKRHISFLLSLLMVFILGASGLMMKVTAEDAIENNSETVYEDKENSNRTSVSFNGLVLVEKQKVDVSEYFSDVSDVKHKYVVTDSKKASVDSAGILRAKKASEIQVTLKVWENDKWVIHGKPLDVCIIRPVREKTYLYNFLGETKTLSDVLCYKDKSGDITDLEPDCDIQLSSDNEKVIAVNNEDNTFNVIKYGTAKLKIRFITEIDGKQKVVYKTTQIRVREPKLSVKSQISLQENKTKTIKLKNVPADAEIVWSISNQAALSIVESKGSKIRIKAINSDDTATVTASYKGHKYSVDVNTFNPDATPGKNNEDAAAKTEVHFLDVGQGDCTIITCDGHAMIIDGGPESKGTAIQLYLTKLGITTLDYVIVTHYDTDHAGGADVIIEKFRCNNIIMPSYAQNNVAYRNLIQTIRGKNYKITPPVPGTEYKLGDAVITILSPASYTDNYNNNSICLRVDVAEDSFLFTGDADSTIESQLLKSGYNLEADVYKVGHHGSRNSSSAPFIEKVQPKYAVVSCGVENKYGHPHAATLNILRAAKVSLYRTDEQGVIIASTSGKGVTWNTQPTTSWKPGEGSADDSKDDDQEDNNNPEPNPNPNPNPTPTPGPDPSVVTYVINTNTKKFHIPTCASVKQIAPNNRVDVDWTREKCISEGFVPCKNCDP